MREHIGNIVIGFPIPEWTAHVGQTWRVYDEAPLNLYNILWVAQQRICRWAFADPRSLPSWRGA